MTPNRNRLLGAIHAVAKKRGLDDDTYRDLLERVTGKRSAKELSITALNRVLDELNGDRGGAAPVTRHRHGPLDGQKGMIRALWISLWHLGVSIDNTDAALDAFVARQTKVSSLRFVQDVKDARAVIEALKSWLTREGVDWTEDGDPRICVVRAQWRRLAPGAGAQDIEIWLRQQKLKKPLSQLSDPELDQTIRKLGAWIRKIEEAERHETRRKHG